MQTIIIPPAPYSSIKQPVLFGIERPYNHSVCEVSINGYLKLLPNEARAVNVASYFREEFDLSPRTDQQQTLAVYDGVACKRVAEAMVSVDGADSETIPLICADRLPDVDCLMSDQWRRVIARGQIDEIPVYLSTPAVMVYGTERVTLPAGVSFVGLHVPYNAPDRFLVTVETPTGRVLIHIAYLVEERGGVRLAWINPYGAIDYWNFTSRRKAQTKITRQKMYSQGGYLPTSIQAETTHTVTTQPLSEQTLKNLSWVYMSDQVWLIDGAVYPVDIVTDTMALYEADKPGALQIEYRSKIRQL